MRLNKYLSKAGIASRRAADQLIAQGRVKVNGEVITALGTIVDENNDDVEFNGKPARIPKDYVYLVLNKPAGYLVTCKDEMDRPKVTDLVGKYGRLVRPVGRLDLDSSGLLLLTNDGELAFRLSHPRYSVDKKYMVKCEGYLSDENSSKLAEGIELDDGMTWPAEVEIVSRSKNFSRFHITIHEGRKRQVRRMCQAVGNRVLTLSRVRYGNIELGSLKSGSFRVLTQDETKGLKALVKYE